MLGTGQPDEIEEPRSTTLVQRPSKTTKQDPWLWV
jgi:hypothetical protein